MQKRVQSPSSIKTYKQCPRKYYYSYILELEALPNIHSIRGNIAHSALEHFFDTDTNALTMDNYETGLKAAMQKQLLNEWQNYKQELEKLQLTQGEKIHYFEETLMMLFNWLEAFLQKIKTKQGSFNERFAQLTPIRELMFTSEKYGARGIIDAIEKNGDGTVRLMDYKTSNNENLKEHLLQLSIYSLLYYEKHGTMPKQAGVYFLKGKEQLVDVDDELLETAKKAIAHIHSATESREEKDYPRKTGALCKWSTGQCPYYETCKPFG